MAAPGFWNDQESARTAVQQVKELKGWVEPYDRFRGRITASLELDELLAALPDPNSEPGWTTTTTRCLGLEIDL